MKLITREHHDKIKCGSFKQRLCKCKILVDSTKKMYKTTKTKKNMIHHFYIEK